MAIIGEIAYFRHDQYVIAGDRKEVLGDLRARKSFPWALLPFRQPELAVGPV